MEIKMLNLSNFKALLLSFQCLLFSNAIFAQNSLIKLYPDHVLTELSNDSLQKIVNQQFMIHPQFADKIYDLLILRAMNSKNNIDLFHAYQNKGRNLEDQSQFQKALQNYSLAANSVLHENSELLNVALTDIAIVHLNLKNYPESRNSYLKILDNATKQKDLKHQYIANCGIGVLYLETNDINNAIRYFKEAYRVAELSQNKEYICVSLANLSEGYNKKGQNSEALTAIEKAYQLILPTQDYETKNFIYERYAQILAETGRFEDAFAKINEGLPQCQGEYAQRYINVLSIAKGQILLKQKNITAAEEVFLACLSRQQNVANQTKINYELGKLYKEQGQNGSAKSYLIAAQTLAQKNEFPLYDELSHRALYYIFDKEANATQALFHLKQANALRDTMFSFEKYAKLSELQFRFDLEQSEHQIKQIELESNQKLMVLCGIAAILIIGGLIYILAWRIKTYQNLKAKNSKIAEQNAQLEAANHELIDKNEEIEAQKRSMEESNNVLRQFSYAVAHDLKEPLRTISSFVSIIQRKYAPLLPPESSEYINYVTSGTSRMGQMLEGMLRYSVMANQKNIDLETFALSDVVQEVVESLRSRIDEREAVVVFKKDMPIVTMNRQHAIQLVQNLLNNGLKFVDKTPKIDVTTNTIGEKVIMSIRDNGIGIEKDSGAKLFQLFHRVHKGSGKFEGTGVGLALCKNIVEKYNGKIWFESEFNHGTEFFVELPKAA
jgi:signal transduction histidine kinase